MAVSDLNAELDLRNDTPPPRGWQAMAHDVTFVTPEVPIDVEALEALLAEPPTRDAKGFTGLVRPTTDRGDVPLVIPLLIDPRTTGDGIHVMLEGHVPSLSLMLWIEPGRSGVAWRVEPNSGDASARADVLDFLWALSGTGRLQIADGRSGHEVGTIQLRGSDFDIDLERDLRFLGDVATIEAWTGEHFVLPREVSSAEVVSIAQIAEIIRSRRVPLRVNGNVRTISSSAIRDADELRLARPIEFAILGRAIDLGEASGSIRVRLVEQSTRGNETVFEPVDEKARHVEWDLAPPAGFEESSRTGGEDHVPAVDQEWFWTDEWQAVEAASTHERETGQSVRHDETRGFLSYLDEHS